MDFAREWQTKMEEKKTERYFSDNGRQLSQGSCPALSLHQLPPLSASPLTIILVCVGGGALLAVKHLSLLRFGIFFFPISFFPPIDPVSCHVSSPAYPSLTQTPLHFISVLPSANSPCLLPIETQLILSSSCQCRGDEDRHEPQQHVAGLATCKM